MDSRLGILYEEKWLCFGGGRKTHRFSVKPHAQCNYGTKPLASLVSTFFFFAALNYHVFTMEAFHFLLCLCIMISKERNKI
jgi:hypothetical protein